MVVYDLISSHFPAQSVVEIGVIGCLLLGVVPPALALFPENDSIVVKVRNHTLNLLLNEFSH